MFKMFLGMGAALLLFSAGCGGGGSSVESTGGSSAATTFRLPSFTAPIRREEWLHPKSSGLVGPEPKPIIPNRPPPEDLYFIDLIEGIGHMTHAGSKVTVQYVGSAYDTKKVFASSWKQGRPLTFTLGKGEVIPGLEKGLLGMEVSDRRELIVPPDETHGGDNLMGKPPQNTTLVYVVDLLKAPE
jgi:peptidylprolyl isomerase